MTVINNYAKHFCKLRRNALEILAFIVFLGYIALCLALSRDWLSIVFSPEVLVGFFGILSWLYQKKKERDQKKKERDQKAFEILKDIEKIYKYYGNNSEGLSVTTKCGEHLEELEKEYKNSDNTFLITYLEYVRSVLQEKPKEDNNDDTLMAVNNDSIEKNKDLLMDSENNVEKVVEALDNTISLGSIKKKIGDQERNLNKKYIRYSRNYEEGVQDSKFKWATWYSVPKELIEDSNDNFIFFTKVDGKYKGVKISGKNLKELIKRMKPSTEQNSNQTYDFYICEKLDGTYFENRHKIKLGKYDVEKLNLDYLN